MELECEVGGNADASSEPLHRVDRTPKEGSGRSFGPPNHPLRLDGRDGTGVPPAMTGPTVPFKDRQEAGRLLAERLVSLSSEHPIVLALPRGGVPVGFEIARRLQAPLDLLIVRKVGAPDNPEYGLGAVAEDGSLVLDEERTREAGYSRSSLEIVIEQETEEAHRRASLYRSARPRIPRSGRTVIVVDDGAATGGTLLAAIRLLRKEAVGRIVIAVGVAPEDTCRRLAKDADELVVLRRPRFFFAVGQFYLRFEPVEDDQVLSLLTQAMGGAAPELGS